MPYQKYIYLYQQFVELNHEEEIKKLYIDGLVQERRNSSALAMELRLSSTKPSTFLPWPHESLIRTKKSYPL